MSQLSNSCHPILGHSYLPPNLCQNPVVWSLPQFPWLQNEERGRPCPVGLLCQASFSKHHRLAFHEAVRNSLFPSISSGDQNGQNGQ